MEFVETKLFSKKLPSHLAESRFLLLTLYAKNELEDLTTNEIKLLKRIVEEWDNA